MADQPTFSEAERLRGDLAARTRERDEWVKRWERLALIVERAVYALEHLPLPKKNRDQMGKFISNITRDLRTTSAPFPVGYMPEKDCLLLFDPDKS